MSDCHTVEEVLELLDEQILGADVHLALSPPSDDTAPHGIDILAQASVEADIATLDNDVDDHAIAEMPDQPLAQAEMLPLEPMMPTPPPPSPILPDANVADDDTLVINEQNLDIALNLEMPSPDEIENDANSKEPAAPLPPSSPAALPVANDPGVPSTSSAEPYKVGKLAKVLKAKKPAMTLSIEKVEVAIRDFNSNLEHDFELKPCHHFNFGEAGCNREPKSIHGNYEKTRLHICFDCYEIAGAIAFHRRNDPKCTFTYSP